MVIFELSLEKVDVKGMQTLKKSKGGTGKVTTGEEDGFEWIGLHTRLSRP